MDEFGRGTEPRAARAAVAALVAELSAVGSQFVVATHLHDVVDTVQRLGLRPACWRMGMRAGNGRLDVEGASFHAA